MLAIAVILALGFGLGLRPSDDDDQPGPGPRYGGRKCRSRVPASNGTRRATNVECTASDDQRLRCPAG